MSPSGARPDSILGAPVTWLEGEELEPETPDQPAVPLLAGEDDPMPDGRQPARQLDAELVVGQLGVPVGLPRLVVAVESDVVIVQRPPLHPGPTGHGHDTSRLGRLEQRGARVVRATADLDDHALGCGQRLGCL